MKCCFLLSFILQVHGLVAVTFLTSVQYDWQVLETPQCKTLITG